MPLKQTRLVSAVEIIHSKDEYGFAPVLEAFPSARVIRIATFNALTTDASWQLTRHLLDHIKNLEDTVQVLFVTNIPKRFDSYTGKLPADGSLTKNSARGRAKAAIDAYLQHLNPSLFRQQMVVLFNFHNHSKIIATHDLAYVGSANFSPGSQRNLESGVLVAGDDAVDRLWSEYYQLAISDSVPYDGSDDSKLKIELEQYRHELTYLLGVADSSRPSNAMAEGPGQEPVRLSDVIEAVDSVLDSVDGFYERWKDNDVLKEKVLSHLDAQSRRRIRQKLSSAADSVAPIDHDRNSVVAEQYVDEMMTIDPDDKEERATAEERAQTGVDESYESLVDEIQGAISTIANQLGQAASAAQNIDAQTLVDNTLTAPDK